MIVNNEHTSVCNKKNTHICPNTCEDTIVKSNNFLTL